MVFQAKKGYGFKTRLSRPGRKAVTLGMGTSDPGTAEREVAFLETMKARRRWDVIDLLMDKRLSLPKAYDNYESGTLDAYIKEISSPDLDPLVTEWSKTANAKYVKQVRTFIPQGVAFPSTGFTRAFVANSLASLKVSGSTRNRYRAALSVAAGWLVEREILESNPVKQVKASKPNPARELYHEREEARLLVNGLPSVPFRAIEALMANGLERQAIASLLRKDIDLDRLTVNARGLKTKSRNRVIRITEDWTLPHIKAHLNGMMPNAPVLTIKLDRVLDTHKRTCEAVKIQVTTLHDWRHTYAVNSLRDGMQPETVARQLGHKDASLVHKLYGKFIVDERDYVTKTATSTRKRMK